MSYFALLFFQIIVPILILLGIGALLQIKFAFRVKALSQLVTYCFMPAAVFINLYETVISLPILTQVIGFVLLFIASQMILGSLGARLLKLPRSEAAVFKNSIVLINSGNYGLPVAQLLFVANPVGVAIQVIMVILQNITTYTYGLYNLISTTKSGMAIVKEVLKMPIVLALVLGALMNFLHLPIPAPIRIPLDYIADGFVAVALITLGAQLSTIEVKSLINKTVVLSSFFRLLMGPVVAFGLILALGLEGVIAQSLLIASAFPTSRNSASLALEYDVDANTAAQTVLFSTVVSALTVTVVIYVSTILFR
ncbi:AEC family transporter [Chryseomicrobium sp. FSL W7-1435]|uniref:AEC family transporter n=1 Tax=Chryseomicrobium sp. FSL W7-1435 TaxID=2921704 RepID=UPI00315A7F57